MSVESHSPVHMRLTPDETRRLRTTAESVDASPEEVLRALLAVAATGAALDLIRAHLEDSRRVLRLDSAAAERFLDALDDPPRPSKRMIQLMARAR